MRRTIVYRKRRLAARPGETRDIRDTRDTRNGARGRARLASALLFPVFFCCGIMLRASFAGSSLRRAPAQTDAGALLQARRRADKSAARARKLEQELETQRLQLAFLARTAMLGELSGALAHELSQPLTAILYNARAAQRGAARDPACPQEVRQIVDSVIGDANRAIEVIRRLQALFMRNAPRREPVDLNQLIDETLELVHKHLQARQVKVARDLQRGLLRIRGDSVQLLQVLINLVLNACDAMQAAPPEQRVLTLQSRVHGGHSSSISVSDTGAGIPVEAMEHLFEPFFTTKPGGTGFGLSISRTIIANHGGKIEAANNPDRGATFCISFPETIAIGVPSRRGSSDITIA